MGRRFKRRRLADVLPGLLARVGARSAALAARALHLIGVAQHAIDDREVDPVRPRKPHAALAEARAPELGLVTLDRVAAGIDGDVILLVVEADQIVGAGRTIAWHAPLHPLLPAGKRVAAGRAKPLHR